MFGIGMPELLLIMAVALIVIGPKKLPDLARGLGKALGEFKKATSELKDSLEVDTPLKDVKRSFDDLNRDLKKNIARKTMGEPVPKKESSPTVQLPPEPYLNAAESSADNSEQNSSAVPDSKDMEQAGLEEKDLEKENPVRQFRESNSPETDRDGPPEQKDIMEPDEKNDETGKV